MSWRELEGKRIEQVRPVDQDEVVLELEGGELAKIRAKRAPSGLEAEAELEVQLQKAKE
jgi:hypothetical protein